jgi:hypothetical protein
MQESLEKTCSKHNALSVIGIVIAKLLVYFYGMDLALLSNRCYPIGNLSVVFSSFKH